MVQAEEWRRGLVLQVNLRLRGRRKKGKIKTLKIMIGGTHSQ